MSEPSPCPCGTPVVVQRTKAGGCNTPKPKAKAAASPQRRRRSRHDNGGGCNTNGAYRRAAQKRKRPVGCQRATPHAGTGGWLSLLVGPPHPAPSSAHPRAECERGGSGRHGGRKAESKRKAEIEKRTAGSLVLRWRSQLGRRSAGGGSVASRSKPLRTPMARTAATRRWRLVSGRW